MSWIIKGRLEGALCLSCRALLDAGFFSLWLGVLGCAFEIWLNEIRIVDIGAGTVTHRGCRCGFSADQCHIKTIKTALGRADHAFAYQAELTLMGFEELGNLILVFTGQDTAGGVDQLAAAAGAASRRINAI